jgi:peptidoglycan-associated lipoprotein
MNIKNISFLLLFSLIFAGSILAQSIATASADLDFANRKYMTAVDKYKKLNSKIKNKAEKKYIRYQMAECYRYMNMPKKAVNTYKSLYKKEYYKKTPGLLLNYANTLKKLGKYDDAIPIFEKYISINAEDPRGKAGILSCQQSAEWIANPTPHVITNPSTINSKYSDFAPTYASDNYNSLIFTSDREGSTGDDIDEWTNQNFSDLYFSRMDRKGEWSEPTLIDEDDIVNTEANEGSPMMNSSFSTLYFMRCGKSKKAQQGCHIYTAKRSGRSYRNAALLEGLTRDTLAVLGHPTLSSDEKMIVFIANFPDGSGGMDLWYATRKKRSDKFRTPKNLGSLVNTPDNEIFPFLRNDSTLYFASEGHPGMGGLDIFKTTFDGEKWSKPENLGYPINSNSDDFAIIFNPSVEEEGYFSSNRKKIGDERGKGKDDIWHFEIAPKLFTLSGVIKDDRSLLFMEGVPVKIAGSDGSSYETTTNSVGFYEFKKDQILKNTTYTITVAKDKYFTESATETTVGLEKSKDLVRDFVLRPIPKEPIVLPDILYDLGKWDLKPQFQDSLQGLIETLEKNPTIVIELASHTDSRDTEKSNDILSQKRAQSVVDYLIERGISPGRLVAKGYGERIPRTLHRKYYFTDSIVLDSATVLTEDFIGQLEGKELQEFAHQLNRRTEFRVLRNDFVPTASIKEQTQTAKVEIVTEKEIEKEKEISIPVKYNSKGKPGFKVSLNGYSMTAWMDIKSNKNYIALDDAINLLRDGAISKTDFDGDVNVVLANSTIADKSRFTIQDFKVGEKLIHKVKIIVNTKLKGGLYISKGTYQSLNVKIDKENKKLIFK